MNSPKALLSSLSIAFALFLAACGSSSSSAPEPTSPPSAPDTANSGDPAATADPAAACIRTGCSGTVCAAAGKEEMTTCEMRPEYECYASATCEKQTDGNCGWTQTAALSSCLSTAGK